MKPDVPLAFVSKLADGRTEVVKLAPLRLALVDGPGLLVTYGDRQVLLDGGTPEDGVTKLSTASLSDDGGGGIATDGLHVDPRKLGDGWAYEVKAEGRRVVWAPSASAVPDWCDTADLVFAAGGATPPANFAGRVVDASQAGTAFLLRQSSLARSPGRKAVTTPAVKATMGSPIRKDAAKRYLFAPMYPASPETPTAGHLDAHNDFGTADDLQAAVWDYVRKGDRAIRLQHLGDTEIGECVEIVSWPFPVTVPLALPDGTVTEKAYEPGTVFMGAVMTPLGWELAQKGLITGWSLGGSCHRMEVEIAS